MRLRDLLPDKKVARIRILKSKGRNLEFVTFFRFISERDKILSWVPIKPVLTGLPPSL